MHVLFTHADLGGQVAQQPMCAAPCGFCCTLRHTFACTPGFAVPGLLLLSFASRPSIPDSSIALIHEIVQSAWLRAVRSMNGLVASKRFAQSAFTARERS